MYYKGVLYARDVNNDIAPTIDSVTWYQDSKEILDSDLANELENHYETMITHNLFPQTII